ncbi:MAG: DUF2283 domain-containing protein [Candidatus Aenigmatarchaeota archaeon]
MEKVNFRYDKENDILYLFKDIKPRGSIECGDFIVEFTADLQKAVGLEILNASKVLSKLFPKFPVKSSLMHIKKASLRTIHRPELIIVQYAFFSKIQRDHTVSKEFSQSIAIPQIAR